MKKKSWIFFEKNIFSKSNKKFSRRARAKIFLPKKKYCVLLPCTKNLRRCRLSYHSYIWIFEVTVTFWRFFGTVRARVFLNVVVCWILRAPKILSKKTCECWGVLGKKISRIHSLVVEICSFVIGRFFCHLTVVNSTYQTISLFEKIFSFFFPKKRCLKK